jgi:hypothetical protein
VNPDTDPETVEKNDSRTFLSFFDQKLQYLCSLFKLQENPPAQKRENTALKKNEIY